jgi:competence protein ComEA
VGTPAEFDPADGYLDAVFEAEPVCRGPRTHRLAARSVLRALLPRPGETIEGRRRTYRELLSASGYASRPLDFDGLLRILDEGFHLITPTGPDGRDEPGETSGHRGDHSYQLTHDCLVEPVSRWLARRSRSAPRDRLEPLPGGPSAADPEPRRVPQVDINSATEAELKRLPGVGSALARRIIEGRPCHSVGELLRIKGISAKKLEEIKSLVRIG